MSVTVRSARASDGPAMGGIHVAAWRAAYRGVMPAAFLDGLDPVRVGKRWSERLDAARADSARADAASADAVEPWEHLVAVRDGEVVGMATVGPARDAQGDDGVAFPAAQLWMLNIHPSAFGRGIAGPLHAAALASLAAHGAHEAYLWVATDNPRARRFYEREGWRADGVARSEELGGVAVDESRYVRGLDDAVRASLLS